MKDMCGTLRSYTTLLEDYHIQNQLVNSGTIFEIYFQLQAKF